MRHVDRRVGAEIAANRPLGSLARIRWPEQIPDPLYDVVSLNPITITAGSS